MYFRLPNNVNTIYSQQVTGEKFPLIQNIVGNLKQTKNLGFYLVPNSVNLLKCIYTRL
jgi:hypothetical protein